MNISLPLNFRMNFKRSVILSIMIHIIALIIFAWNFEYNITKTPPRILKVKLGSIDFQSDDDSHRKPQKEGSAEQVKKEQKLQEKKEIEQKSELKKTKAEQQIKKAVRKEISINPVLVEKDQPVEKKKKEVKNSAEKEQQQVLPQEVKKMGNADDALGVKGSVLGNEALAEQEKIYNYGQKINLWLTKHKRYPAEAMKKKLTGEAVLYLQINRKGEILFHHLVEKTGYAILDAAALEMVERAKKVPPVPDDYRPNAKIFDFFLDVVFIPNT